MTFVGELRPDKGIETVLAACDLIADKVGERFRLVVIGDGALRSKVETAAASRRWLDVRGQVSREDIAHALRSSRAFVLAPQSHRRWAEQFGYASVEAMACGLPVVATTCGAIPEVVPSFNPLVAENDVRGLAAGLLAALGPDGDDWGRRNVDYVAAHYSLDVTSRSLRDTLEAVVALAGRGA